MCGALADYCNTVCQAKKWLLVVGRAAVGGTAEYVSPWRLLNDRDREWRNLLSGVSLVAEAGLRFDFKPHFEFLSHVKTARIEWRKTGFAVRGRKILHDVAGQANVCSSGLGWG